MPAIDDYNAEGVLTLNSVSMNRPAWAILGDETGAGGLLPLFYKMNKRGDDRIIPGAAGVVAYPRRATSTTHGLRLAVTGDVDANGDIPANSANQLAANLAYIFDNVINASVNPVAVTLVAYGQTLTGTAHVIDLIEDHYNLEPTQSIFVGTLRIEILAGVLV